MLPSRSVKRLKKLPVSCITPPRRGRSLRRDVVSTCARRSRIKMPMWCLDYSHAYQLYSFWLPEILKFGWRSNAGMITNGWYHLEKRRLARETQHTPFRPCRYAGSVVERVRHMCWWVYPPPLRHTYTHIHTKFHEIVQVVILRAHPLLI